MTVRHPEIRVSVVPEARGDFRIVDHVTKALRKAGVPREEIDQFATRRLRLKRTCCKYAESG